MKKLIPALCMLLVAACLMGTSTYAWFAANETVSASGMSIKAAADGGLAIASWKGTVGGAPAKPVAADFTTEAESLWTNIADGSSINPTSNNGSGVWYKAGAATLESHEAKADSYAEVATVVNYDAANSDPYVAYIQNMASYAQIARFEIKSMDENAAQNYTLKLDTITVNGSTTVGDALNDSLRIAVYCNGDWTFYAPRYPAGTSTKFYYANGTATPTEYNTGTNETLNFGTAPKGVLCENLTNAGTTVEVYVYFEGEDENCMTTNIREGVDTLTIEFTFSAVKS